MTGELIQFEKYRDYRKIQLFRPGSAPRGAAAEAGHARLVDLRVARITRLLTELEELTRLPKHVPSTILDQARDGLAKARSVVGAPTAAVDLGGAPQPELDDERIERMYRELNQHA